MRTRAWHLAIENPVVFFAKAPNAPPPPAPLVFSLILSLILSLPSASTPEERDLPSVESMPAAELPVPAALTVPPCDVRGLFDGPAEPSVEEEDAPLCRGSVGGLL